MLIRFLAAPLLLLGTTVAFANPPRRVTCSVTINEGGNPETGEGGVNWLNQFILERADPSGLFKLYYIRGSQEALYARDLRCDFSANDPTIFHCAQEALGVPDCVTVERRDHSLFSVWSVAADSECVEDMDIRVHTTTFVQMGNPRTGGGCFAD